MQSSHINFTLDTLESRQLFSANPIITEFMASNQNTLQTTIASQTLTPDWIEIKNQGDTPINLQNWFLTDDPTNLTKWQFPDTLLNISQHTLIFASGQNTTDDLGYLHTNFSLDASGEYLALVKPDGLTIANQYGTAELNYLPQKIDISYGLGTLQQIQPGITLTADPATGNLAIQNYSVDTINLHAYVINSQTGNLNPQTWNSLADQGQTGWQESNPSNFMLAELNIQNNLTLAPGQVYYLGQSLNNIAIRDLTFTYVLENQTTITNGNTYYDNLPINEPGDWVQNHADDFSQQVYFEIPTPGQTNNQGILGYVQDTQFNIDRGFYETPISVQITTITQNASIIYTTDGSTPTAQNGIYYSGPITINTTTTLRAAAFLTGYKPSNTDTQSYFFTDSVIQQNNYPKPNLPTTGYNGEVADYEMDPEIVNHTDYKDDIKNSLTAIPTLSLVMNQDDFFGPDGINQNPTRTGFDWERATSVEFIYPNGENQNLQIDAGIRVQGGASRQPFHSPKHSLSLRFRETYGDNNLNAPLFQGSSVTKFDSLHLRASFNNSWVMLNGGERARATLLRDQLTRDALLAMGQEDAGQGTFTHLYINGIYWGIYNMHERLDAAHAAEWNGGAEEDYDSRNGTTFTNGNQTAWNEMAATIKTGNWNEIQKVIDVQNFIDYTIIEYYGSNNDLYPSRNWKAVGGGANRNPWKFYAWDSERTLEANDYNKPSSDPTGLLADLKNIPEFIIQFQNTVQKHLFNNGALTAQNTLERLNNRASEIQTAIISESARWGDYRRDTRGEGGTLYTKNDHWLPEISRLLTTDLPIRSQRTIDLFISEGLFPDINAPTFNQNGGPITNDFLLQLTSQYQQAKIYYTTDGQDPKLITQNTNITTLLQEDAPIKAIVPTNGTLALNWTQTNHNDNSWLSGNAGVGYERTSGYQDHINLDVTNQLFNKNTSVYTRSTFNLTEIGTLQSLTLRLKFDDGFIAYLNGVQITQSNHGNASGNWQGSAPTAPGDSTDYKNFDITQHLNLLQIGKNVLAIHGLNVTKTSSDMLISPALIGSTDPAADVSPSAILYTNPLPLTQSTTIKARTFLNGSWSALHQQTFIAPTPAIVISEIQYNPTPNSGDQDLEFIELHNTTDNPINLENWQLSNAITFQFNNTHIIQPNQKIVIVGFDTTDTIKKTAFQNFYNIDNTISLIGEYAGKLNNAGENIELQQNIQTQWTTIDAVHYLPTNPWPLSADGTSNSLTKQIENTDGTNPLNWSAKIATPGWHAQQLPGDYNNDGTVNQTDTQIIAQNFGQTATLADLFNTRNNQGNTIQYTPPITPRTTITPEPQASATPHTQPQSPTTDTIIPQAPIPKLTTKIRKSDTIDQPEKSPSIAYLFKTPNQIQSINTLQIQPTKQTLRTTYQTLTLEQELSIILKL